MTLEFETKPSFSFGLKAAALLIDTEDERDSMFDVVVNSEVFVLRVLFQHKFKCL